MQNNKPKFEVGMNVYCSTTYCEFQCQIVRTAYPDFLGERFVVRDLATGKEHGVSKYNLSEEKRGKPADYIDDLTNPPTGEYLEWFAEQCAQYGCD